MNRVNFAQRAGIIVDVCAKHGTWFDANELHHIVQFIRNGGLTTAREFEQQEIERVRRLASLRQPERSILSGNPPPAPDMAGGFIGALFWIAIKLLTKG